MSHENFLIEEYRYLTGGIRHHQTAYLKLENYTAAGLAVIYGALFGLNSTTSNEDSVVMQIPWWIWWFVCVVTLISCVRCFQHYVVMGTIGDYVSEIEREIYSEQQPGGFERRYKNTKGPKLFLIINLVCWIIIISATIVIAIYETA